MHELLRTGIPGLDDILGGGVPFGYSWLVEGENGIGKTTLGLQFIHAIKDRPDEHAVYFTFIELPEELYAFAEAFGWDLRSLEREGRLKIIALSPSTFFQELLSGEGMIRKLIEEFLPTRMVIDSVTDLRLQCATVNEFRSLLEAFLNLFRRRKVTSLLIEDTGPENPPSGLIRRVADINMRMEWLMLSAGPLLDRVIQIPKVRGRNHYSSYVLFEIGRQGIFAIPPDYEMFQRPAAISIQEVPRIAHSPGFTTGLLGLDRILGGPMPFESTWLFDFDSASYFPWISLPLFAQALADESSVLLQRSDRQSLVEAERILSPYAISYDRLVREGRIVFGEVLRERFPDALRPAVVTASEEHSAYDYLEALLTRTDRMLSQHPQRPLLVMIYVNTLVSRFGSLGFQRFIDTLIRSFSHPQTLFLFQANGAELDPRDLAYLSFVVRGLIRFWKNDGYQYAQVMKTPRSTSSPPSILVRTSEFPYLELIARR